MFAICDKKHVCSGQQKFTQAGLGLLGTFCMSVTCILNILNKSTLLSKKDWYSSWRSLKKKKKKKKSNVTFPPGGGEGGRCARLCIPDRGRMVTRSSVAGLLKHWKKLECWVCFWQKKSSLNVQIFGKSKEKRFFSDFFNFLFFLVWRILYF